MLAAELSKVINAQIEDQVRMIVTDSYKTTGAPFGLAWKQSLAKRSKRITEHKEPQDSYRADQCLFESCENRYQKYERS